MVDLGKSLHIPTSPGESHNSVDLSRVEVCSVHGEPCVRRLHLGIPWRPDRPGFFRVGPVQLVKPGLDMNARALQHMVEVVRVEAIGWPICARCRWRRRRWVWPAAVMFFGGIATFAVLALIVYVRNAPQPQFLLPGLLAPVVTLLAAVPFVVASWQLVTRTRGTPDGSAVIVDDPHPAFRVAVRSAGL